jgi:hypothetical protein
VGVDVSDQIDRSVLPIRRPPFKGVADKTLGGPLLASAVVGGLGG